ncbi:MAG: hypothetical protein ACYDH5_11925 [Acidimicrobiales bacterium]
MVIVFVGTVAWGLWHSTRVARDSRAADSYRDEVRSRHHHAQHHHAQHHQAQPRPGSPEEARGSPEEAHASVGGRST